MKIHENCMTTLVAMATVNKNGSYSIKNPSLLSESKTHSEHPNYVSSSENISHLDNSYSVPPITSNNIKHEKSQEKPQSLTPHPKNQSNKKYSHTFRVGNKKRETSNITSETNPRIVESRKKMPNWSKSFAFSYITFIGLEHAWLSSRW